MIKIINNKKIDLTDQEWGCYQQICRSYDRPNFKGEELFVGLFESDNNGNITFINPPKERFVSMEVYLFICSVFQHQQARFNRNLIEKLAAKYEQQLTELQEKIKVV